MLNRPLTEEEVDRVAKALNFKHTLSLAQLITLQVIAACDTPMEFPEICEDCFTKLPQLAAQIAKVLSSKTIESMAGQLEQDRPGLVLKMQDGVWVPTPEGMAAVMWWRNRQRHR